MSSDIDRLRGEASLSRVAMDFGVDLKKDGQEWRACCPFHEERTPSFTIFRGQDGADRFQCFGCGERGDVVDFVQKLKGVGVREAVQILGGEVKAGGNVDRAPAREAKGSYDDIAPIAPVPEPIEVGRKLRLYNPKRAGERTEWGNPSPSMVFPYCWPDGRVYGYVLRNEMSGGGKETPMVMWVRLPDGTECWSRFPFPKPRGLYRQERLKDEGQVIVVEGEKCADALGEAMPNRQVVTWPGGTYGINHVDWSPLAGRKVVIWPDADASGVSTAENVAEILHGLGCEVKVMDVLADDRPKGWDCADAIAEGWGAAELVAYMRATVKPWSPPEGPDDGGEPEPEPLNGEISTVDPDDFQFPPMDAYEGEEEDIGGDFKMSVSGDDGLIEVSRDDLPNPFGELPENDRITIMGGDVNEMRRWVFLTADEKFCNYATGEKMGKGAFDLKMSRVVPFIEYENNKGEMKTIKPVPSKALIEHFEGAIASTTMYRPDVDDALISVSGIEYLNAYLPASVPGVDPDWESNDAWKIVRDHIHNIIPDGAETVINWCAHNVQNPGVLIHWAPIIIGIQGDGKTSIGKLLQVAMGWQNVKPVGRDALASDFTDWGEGAAVSVFEEIRIKGRDASDIMDKLKPYITNEIVPIVPKGKAQKVIINVSNQLGLSNWDDALPLTDDDRRWGAWRTRFKDKAELRSQTGPGYWSRLHDAMDQNAEVIRGWLLSVDLSEFNRFDPPEDTVTKRRMIMASKPPIYFDIEEALELGGVGIGSSVVATDLLGPKIREVNGRSVNTSTLASMMKELGWERHSATVKWRAKSRRVYYRPEKFHGFEGAALTHALRDALEETDQVPEGYSPSDW